jgi:hypothetical protein
MGNHCIATVLHATIWLQVPWDSDPRMTALVRAAGIVNDGPVLFSERATRIKTPTTVLQ